MRVDTSPWNLALPLGCLAACSRIYALDGEGGGTEVTDGSGTTTPTPTTSSSDPTPPDPTTTMPTTVDPDGSESTDGMCTTVDSCGPSQCCIASMCVDIMCPISCSLEQCCYGTCEQYGCYDDLMCGPGAICENGMCLPLDAEPECQEPLSFEMLRPVMLGGEIRSLAFVASDIGPGRDLVIGEGSLVRLLPIDGGEPIVIDQDVDVAALAVADFDQDMDEDIVVADYSVGGVRLLQREQGTFLPMTIAGDLVGVIDIGLVDFELDGLPDVVAQTDMGALFRLRNVGAGKLTPAEPLTDFATSFGAGSIDGDPFLDLVFHQGSTWVMLGSEMSKAMVLSESGDGSPFGRLVTVGNYDGEGLDEVVAVESIAGTTVATMWLGPALEWFAYQSWWPGAVTIARAADVDGDGATDLVTAGGEYQLVIGRGGPAPGVSDMIACITAIPTMIPVWRVAVGDYTGDGRPDLAISDGVELVVLAQQ